MTTEGGNEQGSSGSGTTLTGKADGGGNNQASNSGAGAGGEGNQGGSSGGGNGNNQFVLPQNWQSQLPDDLKNEPSLKVFTDFNTLVKSLVHAQKSIGADKVVVPGKNASADDWKQFWKSTKVIPESLDKYAIKPPDIFTDKESMEALKKVAFEENIKPEAFQKILDTYGEQVKGLVSKNQTLAKQAQEENIKSLKTEWGEKFQTNLKKAQLALSKFGDDSLKKVLDSTGLGNHSAIIKAFSKMGEALGEDSLVGDGVSSDGVHSPGEAKNKIPSLMNQEAYKNADHPNHKVAVAEVEAMFKMAYPEQSA